MPTTSFLLRRASAPDARACVEILRAWIEETPWMPMVHSEQSMLNFWSNRLAETDAWIADAGRTLGFVVRDGEDVTALYVDGAHRRAGIGQALLDKAKGASDPLYLWTFQANIDAQRFYAEQGFVEVERTNGETCEEKLPDIRLRWSAV